MSSAASFAISRESATTTATPSPTCRALSNASGKCDGILISSVTGQAHGSEPAQSAASSAPLNAATTPSSSRAAFSSTRLIVACAYGLRTTDSQSWPGRLMLSMNWPCPVTSLWSSLRGTEVPTDRLRVRVSVVAICPLPYATAAALCTASTMFW